MVCFHSGRQISHSKGQVMTFRNVYVFWSSHTETHTEADAVSFVTLLLRSMQITASHTYCTHEGSRDSRDRLYVVDILILAF